jgi:cytochrome c
MFQGKDKLDTVLLYAAALVASAAGLALEASAQTPPTPQAAANPTATSSVLGDADAGAELYSSVCKECHGVSIAPSLRGVVGRPIASVEFFDYSDALMAKKSMTWTEANLNAFLSSPAEFAPGTQMTKSIDDAQTRADIIAYLATLPPPK